MVTHTHWSDRRSAERPGSGTSGQLLIGVWILLVAVTSIALALL
ncbi:hypothetical protein [Nocardia sp. NPDC005366]